MTDPSDPMADVRDVAVMRLTDFPGDAVGVTLQQAVIDPSSDVRRSASYSLAHHGYDHEPWDDRARASRQERTQGGSSGRGHVAAMGAP